MITDLIAKSTATLTIPVPAPILAPVLGLKALLAAREVAQGVTLAIVADRSARDPTLADVNREALRPDNETAIRVLRPLSRPQKQHKGTPHRRRRQTFRANELMLTSTQTRPRNIALTVLEAQTEPTTLITSQDLVKRNKMHNLLAKLMSMNNSESSL